MEMTDAGSSPAPAVGASSTGQTSSSMTRAEAEVARMANIILFPDRYDFYMAKRNSSGTKRSKVRVERLLNPVDPPSPPKPPKDNNKNNKGQSTTITTTATTTATMTMTTSATPAADGKSSS